LNNDNKSRKGSRDSIKETDPLIQAKTESGKEADGNPKAGEKIVQKEKIETGKVIQKL
jgi:hypothetical protein